VTHRRDLLTCAVTGAIVVACPVLAQPAPPFRIGWIAPGTMAEDLPRLEILRQALRELGYVEGGNLVIDTYWAEHSPARLEALIAALVAQAPHVIVTVGPQAVALRRATQTIPVVFTYSGDPVQAGFVQSYARPGGNFTGISFLQLELAGKRIELLKAVMPGLKRIAVLANPQHPGDQAERRASETAARAVGVEIEYFEFANAAQLDQALEAARLSRNEAALMFPVQTINGNGARIAAWSIRNRIPTISGWARFAEEGNLMTYGGNVREVHRRLATFVDRILKGAKPAEMAVEFPLHIELVLNLKAAKALGITLPQAVILRADRVIE
jgi:putative tryptophan/tyrosine transport system substrate-binding protein